MTRGPQSVVVDKAGEELDEEERVFANFAARESVFSSVTGTAARRADGSVRILTPAAIADLR